MEVVLYMRLRFFVAMTGEGAEADVGAENLQDIREEAHAVHDGDH